MPHRFQPASGCSTQRLAVLASLIVLGGSALAAQATVDSPAELRRIARRVVELEISRQETTGTTATIDSLLALYADSVVYEHPNAGAIVRGKSAMRKSMLDYLGSIRNVVSDPPRITTASRVAVVETSARMEVREDGRWVPVTRHGLRVIEFDRKGLVSRVIDYPW